MCRSYVLVRGAVPCENVDAMKRATFDFLGMGAADPESWHREGHSGMVQMYQSQEQWDNRQWPRVHGAFADLWGTPKLWVSFDMSHMKPPTRDDDTAAGGFVHWDLSRSVLARGRHLRLQGELLLEDMPANSGGFQCVPRFHRDGSETVAQAQDGDSCAVPPMESAEMEGYELRHVTGKAGDLLIWHSFLPHGSCRNEGARPRMMQLITMYPWDSECTFNSNYTTSSGQRARLTLEEERQRRRRQ